MNYKLNIIVLIAAMAIVFPLWLHLNSVYGKKMKIQFRVFNSSNLSGKITRIYSSHGAVRFQLNNVEETYLFIPRMTPFNNYTYFGRISEIGDSVYKPALAATLLLIKVITKKKYKFTFKPPV